MKEKRQAKILEIIKNNIIFTQEDLQKALTQCGIKATQSTVSRDIKELRLFKGHDINGNYRYISASQTVSSQKPLAHYKDLISSSVKSVEYAQNDIIIKCYSGMAQSVCVAVDTIFEGRMLGTLAGEDTILVIAKSTEEAQSLSEEIKKMI